MFTPILLFNLFAKLDAVQEEKGIFRSHLLNISIQMTVPGILQTAYNIDLADPLYLSLKNSLD